MIGHIAVQSRQSHQAASMQSRKTQMERMSLKPNPQQQGRMMRKVQFDASFNQD